MLLLCQLFSVMIEAAVRRCDLVSMCRQDVMRKACGLPSRDKRNDVRAAVVAPSQASEQEAPDDTKNGLKSVCSLIMNWCHAKEQDFCVVVLFANSMSMRS